MLGRADEVGLSATVGSVLQTSNVALTTDDVATVVAVKVSARNPDRITIGHDAKVAGRLGVVQLGAVPLEASVSQAQGTNDFGVEVGNRASLDIVGDVGDLLGRNLIVEQLVKQVGRTIGLYRVDEAGAVLVVLDDLLLQTDSLSSVILSVREAVERAISVEQKCSVVAGESHKLGANTGIRQKLGVGFQPDVGVLTLNLQDDFTVLVSVINNATITTCLSLNLVALRGSGYFRTVDDAVRALEAQIRQGNRLTRSFDLDSKVIFVKNEVLTLHVLSHGIRGAGRSVHATNGTIFGDDIESARPVVRNGRIGFARSADAIHESLVGYLGVERALAEFDSIGHHEGVLFVELVVLDVPVAGVVISEQEAVRLVVLIASGKGRGTEHVHDHDEGQSDERDLPNDFFHVKTSLMFASLPLIQHM